MLISRLVLHRSNASREAHPEDASVLAPLHHRYGHALLEHAIATSGALGGGGGGKDAPMPSRQGAGVSGSGGGGTVATAAATTVAAARAQDSSASSSTSAALPAVQPKQAAKAHDPRFTFGGDAEESDEEERGNVQPQQEGDDEDDEDDLSVAFSVLELARVRYEKVLETANPSLTTIDGETWHATTIKGQLAEVLNDLADVGLESGESQQRKFSFASRYLPISNCLYIQKTSSRRRPTISFRSSF